ncbi:MAG: cobalamin biosynthesis protein, partial [Clostridia bacterium]|nr:cobalamin biosynthesis protein [Clostridia bacterium]
VAENFSDGVGAPRRCMLVGGAPLALTYKAINTMDSMVGYKNEKYVNFGRGAAKLDDVANWIPSRISAFLWMAAAGLTGNSVKGAFRIWKRDRRKHASPNAGQTEAACAGSLGVRLAGPISYFGEPVEKEYIGDKDRKITPKDIGKANRMMLAGSVLCLLIGLAIRFAVCYYNDWIMI